MGEKYLSILTNFGCHYKCPYCVVKNNNIKIKKTKLSDLNNIEKIIQENNIDIISLSGGGDPLHNHKKHEDFYNRVYELKNVELEMHTSYLNVEFDYSKYVRIVYHLLHFDDLFEIERKVSHNSIRVVFVITDKMTEIDLERIHKFVEESSNIDELSFRQMIGEDYQTKYNLHEYLKKYHKQKWHYIEQNDYNLYYVDNKISTKYSDFIGGNNG